MRRLLIAGCGDVARRAMPQLASRYRVYALLRDPARHAEWRALGATPVAGDLDDRRSLHRIAGLADEVLHFAPPPNAGTRDTRTRNLLAALSQGSIPKRIVYISTSGVYGDCGGAAVSECHPLNASSPRALRRVSAERQIRDWARQIRVQASILRVPGIYAAERLPLARIRQGTPVILASEDGYTNHIHADDLARICVTALQRGKPCRVYHASDDSRLQTGEYFDLVADAHGLPRVPRISLTGAQQQLPESLLSFMNESRRLNNQRMKRELKVTLRYPQVCYLLAELEH